MRLMCQKKNNNSYDSFRLHFCLFIDDCFSALLATAFSTLFQGWFLLLLQWCIGRGGCLRRLPRLWPNERRGCRARRIEESISMLSCSWRKSIVWSYVWLFAESQQTEGDRRARRYRPVERKSERERGSKYVGLCDPCHGVTCTTEKIAGGSMEGLAHTRIAKGMALSSNIAVWWICLKKHRFLWCHSWLKNTPSWIASLHLSQALLGPTVYLH